MFALGRLLLFMFGFVFGVVCCVWVVCLLIVCLAGGMVDCCACLLVCLLLA